MSLEIFTARCAAKNEARDRQRDSELVGVRRCAEQNAVYWQKRQYGRGRSGVGGTGLVDVGSPGSRCQGAGTRRRL